MFRVRTVPASADELARQELMWSVIRGEPVLDPGATSEQDSSTLMKKTAAVCGHRQINPVRQLKIYKSLDAVLGLLESDAAASVRAALADRLEPLLRDVSPEVGDVVRLPVRPPILAYAPEPPSTYDFRLPLRLSTGVSLFDFELLAFENRVIYQYYEGVTFSTYFYHNALYMLGTADRLEADERWQARLALLIRRTDFVDAVSMAAFYEDVVRYRGVGYDTSFVPKYDVYSLVPALRIGCNAHCTDEACRANTGRDEPVTKVLAYRRLMDARRVDRVPPEYMSVFLTFPFKDGHYVRPDGTVLFLDVGAPRRASVARTISRICDMSELEHGIADAARSLRLQDVLAYAVHADTLETQGVALLVLRQMIGNVIKVNDTRIRLPYANEVLDWVAKDARCGAESGEVLPKARGAGDENRNSVAAAVALIRDIAEVARSRLAVAFLCSPFHLMERDYSDVYNALATDAEAYVFFTLLVQQYNTNAYRLHRDSLRPEFGRADEDHHRFQYSEPMAYLATKYRVYTRPYTDSSLQDRLDAMTVPLVTPTDVSAVERPPVCDPDRCMELYEFADAQLNELAATGGVTLTPAQLASYITLCVS